MGGYAGLATDLAFAVEYTKDGSPHAHGLVGLCNLYSTKSLWDIAEMLKANTATENAEFISRVKNFVDHLQRSKHFDQEQHTQREEVLEAAFQDGQDESVFPMFHHLCTKPAFLFKSAWQESSDCEQSKTTSSRTEGTQWKAKCYEHCPLIYSSCQHICSMLKSRDNPCRIVDINN